MPRNIRLAEAPSHGMAALTYDPRSKGAESYIKLAKEIIERQAAGMGPQASAAVDQLSAIVSQPSPELSPTEGPEENREEPQCGSPPLTR